MEKRQASKFYPYFDVEEKSVIDKMTGFFNSVVFKQQPLLTEFLDPAQRDILRTIAGNDLFMQDFGGYQAAEKKRVYLTEDWTNFDLSDYGVTAFSINYPNKFEKLSHSAILGSLANSGIETETFGDIITNGNGQWQFFGKSELTDFFQKEITRIGRVKVKVEPIDFRNVIVPEDDSSETSIIVTSLRVDAILSGISNQSRSQIQNSISTNLVKLNWHGIKDSNIIVKVDDVLSLRHFGRCKVEDIRTTRKGKYKVVLRLWQTKKHKQRN